jgi:hypothetical protein
MVYHCPAGHSTLPSLGGQIDSGLSSHLYNPDGSFNREGDIQSRTTARQSTSYNVAATTPFPSELLHLAR